MFYDVPSLHHAFITYAPTASIKSCYDNNGYDTEGTLGKINRRHDVFVYDARTAVIDLNTHMRLPHPFNEANPGNMMEISKRYHVLLVHKTSGSTEAELVGSSHLFYKYVVTDFESNQWNASDLNGIKNYDHLLIGRLAPILVSSKQLFRCPTTGTLAIAVIA